MKKKKKLIGRGGPVRSRRDVPPLHDALVPSRGSGAALIGRGEGFCYKVSFHLGLPRPLRGSGWSDEGSGGWLAFRCWIVGWGSRRGLFSALGSGSTSLEAGYCIKCLCSNVLYASTHGPGFRACPLSLIPSAAFPWRHRQARIDTLDSGLLITSPYKDIPTDSLERPRRITGSADVR